MTREPVDGASRTDGADDDALSWAGDEPLVDSRTRASGEAPSDHAVSQDGEARRGTGAVLLVLYGIIAGIYALYTAGWVVAVMRDPFSRESLLPEIMAQLGELLAIVAPAVWLTATMLLTRGRPGARLGWLVAGVLLLVPVPFILGGN